MREPGREPRLAQEPLPEGRVARQVLGEELDRNRAVQLLVLREVDGRHAAVAERALEAVAAATEAGGTHPGDFYPSLQVFPAVQSCG